MVNESRGLVALVHRLRKGEEELMSELMRHVVNLVKWVLAMWWNQIHFLDRF